MSGRRTSDLSRLPGNAYYPTKEYEDPAWSPDGRRITLFRSPVSPWPGVTEAAFVESAQSV
jgi:hypothetical protein